MICATCNGNGHVVGPWNAYELCPACDGRREYADLKAPDTTITWGLIVGIAVPFVFVIVGQWALWAFLFGVIGAHQ